MDQNDLYNSLMGEDVLNVSSLTQLNSALDLTNRQLQAEREKLAKLLDFNQQSSTVFSDLAGLEASVSAGLSAVETSFGQYGSSGQFAIPKDMTWKKVITVAWEEREAAIDTANTIQEMADSAGIPYKAMVEWIFSGKPPVPAAYQGGIFLGGKD